ncbi:ElyC/SanA/YdcF family protein [Desulfoplanes formicivorans]|uniref:DUF218 domain-containing protein n=1 Tax=Desulfoplanes formicivorans TaxID=1592317 RepID=A0A194AL24_9BACT|nr:ElyC/SanA/YdcF family protein [Desulfoplanes formicivorans]GAU09945.1 hypothetical protein DPF_2681 [Desulfoplanes formicivorans]
MDPFILKKLVSRLFFPVPLCLELLILGIILMLARRARKTALFLVGSSGGLLLLLSLEGPSCLLLHPLETMYPPAFTSPASCETRPRIDWIVVLGGGTVPALDRPPHTRLETNSLSRVIEGVRLARIFPEARMVFTGAGTPGDTDSTAGIMAQTAVSLGVASSRITIVGQAMDTPDEARLCSRLIPANQRLILVTSASHIHRALRLFLKQGLCPIPAPTSFQCPTSSSLSYLDFIPSASNLKRSERAIYEYMGLMWSSLRGLI